MTFQEITRTMLSSMDFFELRRTAARYSVAFQGIRRQKLIRDIERSILAKSNAFAFPLVAESPGPTLAERAPEGAVSAKPRPAESLVRSGVRINMFSTRGAIPHTRA